MSCRRLLVRPAARAALLVAALAPLSACDPNAQGATQVKMHDNAFNAPVVRIPEGAGVTFTNAGRNPHNIVPVDPARWPAAFDTSAVAPGDHEDLTLPVSGVYEFYCSYHGTRDGRGMAGAVVVGDVPYTGGPKGRIAAVAAPSGVTREVPRQYATIQAAVDAATPGDLILVDSGIYKEEVSITTPSLVVRGTDRNAVIVDGEFIRPNGLNVLADAVAIENLTARNHTFNGVFWNGVTGYRGRYLTAHNNGDYGIYAFDSKDGLIEDSYASGSPDAGFYIGQCDPCRAVIRRVVAEHNTLGYSGTNSSGDLHILSSTWRHNRGGIVPNSLDTELYPPQHHTTIRGNLIHDNNSRTAPGKGLGPMAWGMGVVLGGGNDNVVEGNVILGHVGAGVVIAPFLDASWWPARRNVVADNTILNSGFADIAVGGPTSAGNRVEAQAVRVTRSPRHARVQNDLMPAFALAFRMWRLRGASHPDWRTQPVPPPQPSMPGARTAPATPAYDVFAGVQGELADAPLPPETDAVLRAAIERDAPPDGTPRLGRALARAQAWVPLTARLLLLVAALLIAVRRLLLWRARSRNAPHATAMRRWRLVSVTGLLLWVGLALATAVSFSAM